MVVDDRNKDLKQRSFIFALEIIELVDEVSRKMSDQVIGKQLLRSATSIGANVIEVQEASNKIKQKYCKRLLEETDQFGKILGSSIITSGGKRN